MNDVTLLDNYGNVLHYFTQWDINQMIYIEESGFAKAPQFHFQNLKTTNAYVVQSSMDSSGKVSVMVPNELTVVSYPIDIYIYVSDSDSSQTVYHTTIPVYPRKQPNDLIYEDNMEFITISELEERIEKLKDILDGFSVTASDIAYDNSVSGLDATNVQDALDELVEKYVFVDKEFDDGSGDEPGTGGGDDENPDDTKKDGVTSNLEDITLYEPIYLYNYGDTAEQIGGWNTEMYYYDWQGNMYKDVGNISVTENSDHIYFNASSYNNYYASMNISSKKVFDWNELASSEYAYKFNAKYGVLGAYTEEDLATFANVWCSNTVSNVTTQIMLAFMDSSNNNIFTMKSGNGYDELFKDTENSITLEFDINTTPAAHAFQLYQLYLTPEGTDYFIDAWKVIEEAINSMEVTNDTAVEDIQTVVDNALTNASLKGYATATVGNIEKVLATSTEEGFISGSITITSRPENHLMEFTKIIAKLPENSGDDTSGDDSSIDISKVTDMTYLYNEGAESDLIGEYSAGLHYMDENTCTLSKESDHILFTTSEYSSGWANLCPSKNPDLTSYNICGIEYDYSGESLDDDSSILRMFAADTNSVNDKELTGVMHSFIIQDGKNLLVTREMPKSSYLKATSYLIFNFSCLGYKPAGELKIRKIWVGKYEY